MGVGLASRNHKIFITKINIRAILDAFPKFFTMKILSYTLSIICEIFQAWQVRTKQMIMTMTSLCRQMTSSPTFISHIPTFTYCIFHCHWPPRPRYLASTIQLLPPPPKSYWLSANNGSQGDYCAKTSGADRAICPLPLCKPNTTFTRFLSKNNFHIKIFLYTTTTSKHFNNKLSQQNLFSKSEEPTTNQGQLSHNQ